MTTVIIMNHILKVASTIHLAHRESGSLIFKSAVREFAVSLMKECGLLLKSSKEMTLIIKLDNL